MKERLRPTIVDFVIAALNPVLIMILLGSLLFFLVEVFYQGHYSGRLHVVLGLFVLGVVLVTRIAIETDEARAFAFGAPLAVVTYLALWRFVEFGGWLSPLSPVLNAVMMGAIWWVAWRLTWDAASWDRREAVPSKGIWDCARERLFRYTKSPLEKSDPGDHTADDLSKGTKHSYGKSGPDIFAIRERKVPHAPGVWVLYLSLAALPLFGLGELAAGTSRFERRGWLLTLLAFYLASGFGLLLTTSFLNLRTYLRSRRVEMPLELVGQWLLTGGLIISIVLAAAWLIPRPGRIKVGFDITGWIISPRTVSSPVAFRGEPASESRPGHPTTESQPTPGKQEGSALHPASQTEGQTPPTSPEVRRTDSTRSPEIRKPENAPHGKTREAQLHLQGDKPQSQSHSERSGGENLPASQKMEEAEGEAEGAGHSPKGYGSFESPEPESSIESLGAESSQEPSRSEWSQGSWGGEKNQQGTGGSRVFFEAAGSSQEPSPARSRQTSGRESPSGFSKSWGVNRAVPPAQVTEWLSSAFRVLLWILLAIGLVLGLLVAWKHRQVFSSWWVQLQAFWKELWESLFGLKPDRRGAETRGEARVVSRAEQFSDFPNPFRLAQRSIDWETLVVYTFRAAEAWAKQYARPREPHHTPQEFLFRLGTELPEASSLLRRLAEVYSTVVYGPGLPVPRDQQWLEALWQTLEREALRRSAVGTSV